jgi:Tfp pilus assembly protein PilO
MDQLRRYTWPLGVGLVVIIIAMVAVLGWIIPEGHKVSSENINKITLQSQESSLEAEINGLKDESTHESLNCTNLRQDQQLVPDTPTVDLFFHQISQLATSSGTATPEVSITSSGTPATGASAAGADTVGISLSVTGTYPQVLVFLSGLDKVYSLQRLFAVSSVSLSGGSASGSTGSGQTYSLQLQGDIYYSTTQENVCQTATSGPGTKST